MVGEARGVGRHGRTPARGALLAPLLLLLGCDGYILGGPFEDPPADDGVGTGTGIVLMDGTVLVDDGAVPDPPPDGGTSSPGDTGPPLDVDGGNGATGDPDAGPPASNDAGPPPELDAGPPPPPTGCGAAIETRQLDATNRARAEVGLGPLVCDDGLTRAARLHSQDMCDLGYFSHTSADGRSFVDRIDEQGVTWRTAGENIARGQPTPESVHEAWMDSPGHRANILNGAFGRIGIGYVACPGRGPYWTQDFTD